MKNNNSYEDKLNAIVKLESYIFEYIDFFASVLLNEASKEKSDLMIKNKYKNY